MALRVLVMKSAPPPLQVVSPCPKRWSELQGDAKRRFCSECQLHVHNLSAMDEGERAQFVAGRGTHACISYELRADGSMVTPSRWGWLAGPARHARGVAAALLASAVPFLFAACAAERRYVGGILPGKESGPSEDGGKFGPLTGRIGTPMTMGSPPAPEE